MSLWYKIAFPWWLTKNWCFWTMVFEKTLDSPLDCKEFQPVHPKGNQSWIFIGKTDVEAETPILWPPDAKSWLIGKDPDAGKDWRLEEKGTTEDEMVGWHHWLNGHEFEQTPGVGDGQGGLACCSPWGRKESDVTERLNWWLTLSTSSYVSDYICIFFTYVTIQVSWPLLTSCLSYFLVSLFSVLFFVLFFFLRGSSFILTTKLKRR